MTSAVEEMMASQQQADKTDDRTGKYGGDDGALENERVDGAPSEDTATQDTAPVTGKTQAEKKEERDLASGEENPS